jgi:predicted ribosome quality control (RQC) complex YloA/Tae2 family protein
VLTRLVAGWSAALAGSRLAGWVQESEHRFRFSFAREPHDVAIVASIDQESPWVAAQTRRWEGPLWSPAPWAAQAAHSLVGRAIAGVLKDPPDRTVRFDLASGWGFVLELTPGRANVIALGEGGVVIGMARASKSSRSRLTVGQPWSPPALPAGKVDPFPLSRDELDRVIGPDLDAIPLRLAGVGRTAAELASSEHRATARSIGTVLRERLDDVLAGVSEVGVESAASGPRLLPWTGRRDAGGDVAVVAGRYYEAREEERRIVRRIEALGTILRREIDRTRQAEVKARRSLASFDDPQRHQRMGEALLAGLSRARRAGDVVIVPDPYDAGATPIEIPAAPGRPLTKIADELFARHRRALRGLESAKLRAVTLADRAERLETLLARHGQVEGEAGAAQLEAGMREAGIPVGLTRPTRASRASARLAAPRPAGVRMLETSDGFTVLVGRTGKDNDRLTFKIAAPDDVWIHAAGVPGAHVIVRNPERLGTIPLGTIAEAARWALWFSDARGQPAADAHWTRRKNVRRAKGGTSGMVTLKRFETIRVRPQSPPGEDG